MGESLLMSSLSLGREVNGPPSMSSPYPSTPSPNQSKSIGECMSEKMDSPFLNTMRRLFERAAIEKERRIKRNTREKKMNRLENKIKEMTKRLHGSPDDEDDVEVRGGMVWDGIGRGGGLKRWYLS